MSSSSPATARELRAIAALAALACPLMFQSALSPAVAEPAPAPELGIWYDDTGNGAVRISQCGNHLCGHIHWLKSPFNSKGEPLHDAHNPNPAARQRPICGLQVFGELIPQGDGTWDGGWIYDPKVGKSYNVQIRRSSADVLEVYGYAGVKLLGKTLLWRKAPDDLPRCDYSQASSRQP